MATISRRLLVGALLTVLGGVGLLSTQIGCRDKTLKIARNREPEIRQRTLRAGSGAPIVEGKRIELHYTLSLEDGTVLVDTRANRRTHKMFVGDGTVIKGLDDGIRGMRLGEIRRLVIPPELGYGRAGYADGTVPANAKLIVEVELVAVN